MNERYPGSSASSFPREGSGFQRVDFMICGTQKGGTTALDSYLRRHRNICMAREKECHYFDNDACFEADVVNHDQYHALFTPGPETRIVGETTPIYMYWYDSPRRIWNYNSDCKIIVVLRNPIERAYSHWNMEKNRGEESLPFHEAILSERERCRVDLPRQHRVYSYVDRGFYLEQLRRLWFYFGFANVLVIKSELLRLEPLRELNRVCDFLGVERFGAIQPISAHAGEYAVPMNEEEKAFLRDVYRYEIPALEAMLGWDCSDWLA